MCKEGEIRILHGPAVNGNIKLIKSLYDRVGRWKDWEIVERSGGKQGESWIFLVHGGKLVRNNVQTEITKYGDTEVETFSAERIENGFLWE